MLSGRKVWLGLVAAFAALTAASVAEAQDFGTLKGDNGRTGKNANPVTFGPGVANLIWFYPNKLSGNNLVRSVRDNNSGTFNNTITVRNPGANTWLTPASGAEAAFAYIPPHTFNDFTYDSILGGTATDQNRLGNNPRPAYEYTGSVFSAPGSHNDPTVNTAGIASFSWSIDPTVPEENGPINGTVNYQLYVWMPNGPTGPAGGPFLFPNRFFVYKITYGTGQTWIDVVDTNVAGQGWIRLGNGGMPTNQIFPYQGTPITITLYNTEWRDEFDRILEDNTVPRVVYADAVMAVPDYGSNTSSPVAGQIGTGINVRTQVVQATNLNTLGTQNGKPVTVVVPVVQAFDGTGQTGAGNPPIWKWSPLDVTPFTTTLDNVDATPNTNNWVSENIVNHHGADYLTNTITNTPPPPNTPPDSVIYKPNLEDGDYLVQVYNGGNNGGLGQIFGTQTQVWVYEGNNPPTQIAVDQTVAGWVTLGVNRRFKHRGTIGENLKVYITNYSTNPGDLGLKAYADEVRFVGAFNESINSTPVQTKANIKLSNGVTQLTDVVIVAADDGHVYCLDAMGNGDGTTTLYWAWPTIILPNTNVTDPNVAKTQDGDGTSILIDTPDTGFGLSSPLVQNMATVANTPDYCFIGAKNGRVYCLDMTGRGDYNVAPDQIGTTDRVWSYPSDYPAFKKPPLPGGFGGSVAWSNLGPNGTVYVPTMEGRMFALDAAGGINHATSTRWTYPNVTVPTLGAITTTPAVDFGRIYFGTARVNDTVPGQFYALDADTGAFVWKFEGDPNVMEADNFRGGPCTATAAQLGIPNNMVYCSNDNLFVYGLDADTGTLLWNTSELNSPVTANLTFVWMSVPDQTGTGQPFPLVLIPTDDGRFDGFFARPNDVNVDNLKLAWEYISASSSIVSSMSNARSFLYGADTSGYLYAWGNGAGVGGLGVAPGSQTVVPNDPGSQAFRNSKLTRITKDCYDQLRQSNMLADPTGDTAFLNETQALAKSFNRSAFEWGEIAYFMVYDFPVSGVDSGGNAIAPPIVQFQIGVEGASVRQYGVQAKHFAPPPGQYGDGYAILAFPIQGAGPTSLPPGSATVKWSFSTSVSNPNGQVRNIAVSKTSTFTVANPLGIYMPDANGNMGGLKNVFGVNTDPTTVERNTNGSPNINGGTDGRTLGQSEGVVANAQTGIGNFWLVDMSMMNHLRGGEKGLENVHVTRQSLVWQGGAGAVWKPLNQLLYPGFEDLPVNFPNSSLDYPDISRENLRVTKDPNGAAQNLVSGTNVFLTPPILPANYDDSMLLQRVPQPVLIQLEVDVPRYQPFNNDPLVQGKPSLKYFVNSGLISLPSGYVSRLNAYVDSNGNNILDNIGGRREAYRSFMTTLAVALDERLSVMTPTVDLGTLAGGTGYSPLPPGSLLGLNNMSPWITGPNYPGGTITTGNQVYVDLFKKFIVANDGNANLIDLRLAHGVNGGPAPGAWAIYSSADDTLAWLDTSVYVHTNFDEMFGLVYNPVTQRKEISLQKARVGDLFSTDLNLNPAPRYNPNLGILSNAPPLFPGGPTGDAASPRIAASPPIGFPVGLFSQEMAVFDYSTASNNFQYLDVDGNNNPLEPVSSPTFTLKLNVREDRATTGYTFATAPMIDYPQASVGQSFTFANVQPTAMRTLDGNLVVAWASPLHQFNDVQPTVPNTDPEYQIFFASLQAGPPVGGSPLADLGGFQPATTDRWFKQAAGPFPNLGNGNYNGLFQSTGAETVIANSEKFGAPAFPSGGVVDPLGGPKFNTTIMALLGSADKQTSATSHTTEFRVMTANVSVNAAGAVGVTNLRAMPYDPLTPKGRPSIYQVQGGAVIFYVATGTGEGQMFYTVTDGTSFSRPTIFPLGNGFSQVSSPSVQVRPYLGAGGAKPIIDLTFVGKLRGRATSEVFYGRALTATADVNGNPVNNAPGTPLFLPMRTLEPMTPDSEAGTYRALGVVWDPRAGFTVRQSINGGAAVNLAAGPPVVDRTSGLIRFDCQLGGQMYVDPNLGTVRFSGSVPLRSATILLDYSPRFLKVSENAILGHANSTVLYDNRIAGDVSAYSYWFNVNSNGSISNVDPLTASPRTARYMFTYTQAAGGPGQAARPFWKTYRVGIQLPTPISTDAGGNFPAGWLTITGAPSGPVQVDPANGRIFFQSTDEDRVMTVSYMYVSPTTGLQVLQNVTLPVGVIQERAEAQVPIDQAVNEGSMIPFLDPFDVRIRPGLIWMFYTSNRAGNTDLYFQGMAPRFTPTINGK